MSAPGAGSASGGASAARPARTQALLDAARLRVQARRDGGAALAGAYRSAHRGRGFEFEELADYVPGDDVQAIEWNASARLGRPIVKRMRAERDLLLALLVDVSDSLAAGGSPRRAELCRAAAALAAAALRAGDRVALALFAGGLLAALPPGGGPRQLERVLRALAGAQGGGAPTDAAPALHWALERLPPRSFAVLLSDGHFPDPGPLLAHCAARHTLLALWIASPADAPPPGLAPLRVRSAEGGARALWRALAPHRGRAAQRPPEPLGARELRRRGAHPGLLHSGPRLIGSLARVLDPRAAQGGSAAPR